MRVVIDNTQQIEVGAEPTLTGWMAYIFDIDEDTGAKCMIAMADGDSRFAAMNWAMSNYFAGRATGTHD